MTPRAEHPTSGCGPVRPSAAPGAPSVGTGGARDPYLDNLKVVLVVLVVVGHGVGELMRHNALAKGVFLWIYTFHMPAFVFVAGLLSKGALQGERRLRLVARTLAPYLIFQILYRVAHHLLFQTATLDLRPFRPDFSLWFLVSLFFWRAMAPYLEQLERPLAFAVAVGLLMGAVGAPSDFLGGSRTFVLLPFFVAGLLARREHLRVLRHPWVRGGAALVLAASLGVAVWLAPGVDERPFFFGSTAYAELGLSLAHGAWARLLLYGGAALLAAALCAVVPARRAAWTDWGRRSLYVYLLHTFLVRVVQSQRLELLLKGHVGSPALQVVLAAVASILVAVLLSQRWVQRVCWPLVEPRPAWVRRGALPVALALLLVAAPASLRHFGASTAHLRDLPRRPVSASAAAPRDSVSLGRGGLIVDLGRRRHRPRVELSLSGGPCRATLYRAGRRVSSALLSAEGPGDGLELRVLRVPAVTRRRGYDMLVLEPERAEHRAQLGHLTLQE